MSNLPGLFVLGEANFSDHGANRLGASALMQGLADGYFVLPYTIGDYLAPLLGDEAGADRRPRVHGVGAGRSTSRCASCCRSRATKTVDDIHRELGKVLWDNCGMARTEQSLTKALARDPRDPRGVLEERARARRERDVATRRSRRPAASPTSSSSAS